MHPTQFLNDPKFRPKHQIQNLLIVGLRVFQSLRWRITPPHTHQRRRPRPLRLQVVSYHLCLMFLYLRGVKTLMLCPSLTCLCRYFFGQAQTHGLRYAFTQEGVHGAFRHNADITLKRIIELAEEGTKLGHSNISHLELLNGPTLATTHLRTRLTRNWLQSSKSRRLYMRENRSRIGAAIGS